MCKKVKIDKKVFCLLLNYLIFIKQKLQKFKIKSYYFIKRKNIYVHI